VDNHRINTEPFRIDSGDNMNEQNPHLYPKPVSSGSYWARWKPSDFKAGVAGKWETVHVVPDTEEDGFVVMDTTYGKENPTHIEDWQFGPRLTPPKLPE